jgi:hypothetical protein
MVKTLLDNRKQLLFSITCPNVTRVISFVVCVIRISLFSGDKRFSGEPAMQGSVIASQQTLWQISPGVIDPVYNK